ncbi:hypothetical protein BMF94_4434 [Rhodotorula taiwanensis]|uniref:Prefoldin subunit 1 n=1 Tax=Rhodotorula taiwanensis TaxID=741276 RepID=A0A2S5B765_9BASI|nr:hypothetical protein BMF94_4434 [Rhodotorula taiwanensis]
MSDDVRQVLVQLQSQQVEASRQLSAVRAQLNAKERDKKLSTLTLREVEQLPREPGQTRMYRGVGRMFVQESRNNVENTLREKMKDATEQATVLEKKAKYLETEIVRAQSSIRDILQESASRS